MPACWQRQPYLLMLIDVCCQKYALMCLSTFMQRPMMSSWATSVHSSAQVWMNPSVAIAEPIALEQCMSVYKQRPTMLER